MTRTESLRRLALWAVGLVVFTAAMYFPTLSGGSPWSWWIGEAPRIVVFLLGLGLGVFAAHWWWPTTNRWRKLEREVARMVRAVRWSTASLDVDGRPGVYLLSLPMHHRLRGLVRPHVLKREGR